MFEEIIEGFRLSPAQQRLWQQMNRYGASVFRSAVRISVRGPLDRGVLRRAWLMLATRHEVLRTTFSSTPGLDLPVQVIGVADEPALDQATVCGGARDGWQVRVQERGDFQSELEVVTNAMLADGQTMQNLVAELARCYEAAFLNRELEDQLSGEVVQYADVSEWQHEMLESEEAERARQLWAGRESGVLRLPHERDGLGSTGYAPPQSVTVKVSREIVERLAEIGSELDASIGEVLEAGWRVLLWHLSGGADVTVARLFDGRTVKHLKSAFGLFAKYLPVPCRLAGTYRFSKVVRQLKDSVRTISAQQDYLIPEDTASLIGFDFESLQDTSEGGRVSFTISQLYSCVERFKLRLSVQEANGGLRFALHYDPAVYAEETVERWAASLATLFANAAQQPQALISELEIIGEREHHKLLVEWNDTTVDYPNELCVHQLFETQVVRTPDVPAVVFKDSRLSYSELNERANQVARYLRRHGVGPEVLVGVCMERSVELVVAVLGVLKAGGAYVPLDPEQPPSRLLRMIADAGTAVLLTQQSVVARFSDAVPSQVVRLDTESEAIGQESRENLDANTRADNLAYVIYTSGSTGTPKGVMVQHRSVLNLLTALQRAIYVNVSAPSHVTLNAPFSFDASVKQLIQLLAGHTLIVVPEEVRRDGEQLLRWLGEQQVTVFDCTPAQLQLLFYAGLGGVTMADETLRAVLVGGEAINDDLWTRLGSNARTRYYNVYGPTEFTVDALVCEIKSGEPASIGTPVANTQAFVLSESQQLLATGVTGELHLGGAGLARGYLNRPELTAEKFVPDAYSGKAGARLYRTGDLVRYLPNGHVEFKGRTDHQVKVRGYRVELGEIEAVLQGHQAVRDCVVTTHEDESGSNRLVAYVVEAQHVAYSQNGNNGDANGHYNQKHQSNGREKTLPLLTPSSAAAAVVTTNGENSKVLSDELRRYLREQLPEYMMPSTVVMLDKLPLTPHGKVDRKALPAPESAGGNSDHSGADLPRTPHEELVANVWESVLNVRAVGRDDNFFELGGHSLLATQVMSRMREVFQIDLPLRTLFEEPTVAAFAASVGEALKVKSSLTSTPPIRPVPRSGELPLSFAQQRLWFLDQWEPSSPFYNSPSVLRLSGRLELTALQRTLFEVVRRHEVLRTSFPTVDGQPRQRIAERWQPALPLIDLSTLDQAMASEAVRGLLQREALQPFNLATGPLLRATLLRLSAEEHVLLFTMHHIVSDGWSMGLLVREVAALYKAYQEGEESPLEELPVQYADYAVWQREWLAGEVLEGQLEYWRQQLAGAPPVLELPTDRPRPRVQSFRGATLEFRLNGELTAGLKELSRRSGVTLFMTLLAGFEVLMWRLSGQEDICIGTAIANRTRRETEGVIGFFVNTLVLRVEMKGEMSSRELLGRVREVCLGAYGHQEVPFERLVEELRPERSLSHTPLFQVAFGLDNAPRQALELPGLKLTGMELEDEVVRFDLTLWMNEDAGELSGRWTYRTELFDAQRVEQMTRQWERLLENMVANPEARIETLEMYSEAEKEQKATESKVRSQANYQKLKGVKPKPIQTERAIIGSNQP